MYEYVHARVGLCQAPVGIAAESVDATRIEVCKWPATNVDLHAARWQWGWGLAVAWLQHVHIRRLLHGLARRRFAFVHLPASAAVRRLSFRILAVAVAYVAARPVHHRTAGAPP